MSDNLQNSNTKSKKKTVKWVLIGILLLGLLCLISLIIMMKDSKKVDSKQNAATEGDSVFITPQINDNNSNLYEILLNNFQELFAHGSSKHYAAEDIVGFTEEDEYNYGSDYTCRVFKIGTEVEVSFAFRFNEKIPASDDDMVYLFALGASDGETLSEIQNIEDRLVALTYKDKFVSFKFPYSNHLLFKKYVPAIKYENSYKPLNEGQFITNPELLADNQEDYPILSSKKGILLDANTLGTDKLTGLNVKRVVFNVPLSMITGETEDEEYPTIEYEYDGEIFHFNGYRCMLFDSLFTYLTDNGYHTTAIILNDWNSDFLHIIHPLSRRKSGKSMYYAFNTAEADGVKLIEATAAFLAGRYSGEHGMVHDWIIANEINQQKIWNYMNTSDVDYYVSEFEKGFRIFYNAIKSNYANAKVYYSVDHDWNDNGGFAGGFFNGKDIVSIFNDKAKLHGDYDWGLSIHPYPQPLTRTRFWSGSFNKNKDAAIVTPMNLSAVTSMLTEDDFLSPLGNVRDIGITELGFTSANGEELQAAAFAYCYYIIEDNEYINSFLLNRQTDDNESLKSGLRLGLYNNDYTDKAIAEVYANIDTENGDEYIQRMLSIIGKNSLEEALEAAR